MPESHVVFLGYYAKERHYLIKGWMRVGKKISYIEALERFGNRPNVIIRESGQMNSLAAVHWKRNELRESTIRQHGTDCPRFLTTIRVDDRTYVQFAEDIHEIDNWKCQRMFRCRTTQLERCIGTGACLREQEFPNISDYVVAAEDGWQDVGRRCLDWRAVAPLRLLNSSLRTPFGQHNIRLLSDAEVEKIIHALA